MTKHQFRHRRLYQQVADHLGRRIKSGEFPQGSALPGETTLATEYEVSRNVMREALVALEILDIVNVRAGAGAFVTDTAAMADLSLTRISTAGGPSPLAILEARRAIEGEVAFHATINATDEQIDRLASMIEEASNASADRPEPQGWPGVFHIELARATGNSVFETIVASLWQAVRGPMFAGLRAQVSMEQIRSRLETRRRLIAEMRRRDAAAARTAMHDHIDMVTNDLFGVSNSKGQHGDANRH